MLFASRLARHSSYLPFVTLLVACGGSASDNQPGPNSNDSAGGTAGDGDGDRGGDGDGVRGDGDGGDGDSGDGDGGDGDSGDGDGGDGDSGDGDTGDGDSSIGGMGGTTSGAGGSTMRDDAEAYCTHVCTTLEPSPSGCFDIYICGDEGQCQENANNWSDTAREAFEWCFGNDPMCFITAEGCMLNHLFGNNSEVAHRVTGSSFDFPDGTKVGIAAGLDGPESDVGEINSGSFGLEYIAARNQGESTHTLLWIDQNGDGVCSAGDYVGSLTPEFNSNFEDPAMVADVSLDDVSNVNHQNCLQIF